MGPIDKVPIVNGLRLSRFLKIEFRAEWNHVFELVYAFNKSLGFQILTNPRCINGPASNTKPENQRFVIAFASPHVPIRQNFMRKGCGPRVDSNLDNHSVNIRRRGSGVLVFT